MKTNQLSAKVVAEIQIKRNGEWSLASRILDGAPSGINQTLIFAEELGRIEEIQIIYK